MSLPDSEELLAGTGRTDITPSGDCFLNGFSARNHGAEDVHDTLTATALALSSRGKRAVIVWLNLLELADTQVDAIWKRAEKKYDLKPSQLLLNCSHTHAGPMVRPCFNRDFCPKGKECLPDSVYIERLLENIITSVGTALKNLTPARIS